VLTLPSVAAVHNAGALHAHSVEILVVRPEIWLAGAAPARPPLRSGPPPVRGSVPLRRTAKWSNSRSPGCLRNIVMLGPAIRHVPTNTRRWRTKDLDDHGGRAQGSRVPSMRGYSRHRTARCAGSRCTVGIGVSLSRVRYPGVFSIIVLFPNGGTDCEPLRLLGRTRVCTSLDDVQFVIN